MTLLPNLSGLRLESVESVEMMAGKRKQPEEPPEPPEQPPPPPSSSNPPLTFQFAELQKIPLEMVPFLGMFSFLRMALAARPRYMTGTSGFLLTFEKNAEDEASTSSTSTLTPTSITLELTSRNIRMRSSMEGENCVNVEIAYGDITPKTMYVTDFFYSADTKRLSCDTTPEYTQDKNVAALVLTVLAFVASKWKANLELQDSARLKQDEAPLLDFSDDQSMTKNLRFKRGFGYYESRGFFSQEIDNHIASLVTDLDDPSPFLKAFQIQLDWVHLFMTTPLLQLEDRVNAFVQSVMFEPDTPDPIKRTFEGAKRVFQENKKTHVKKLVEFLESKSKRSMLQSVRGLTELEVLKDIFGVKSTFERTKNNDYATLLKLIAEYVSKMPELKIKGSYDIEFGKFPDAHVGQRTFVKDGRVYRMNVTIPDESTGRPIASLAPLNTAGIVVSGKYVSL